MTSKIFEPPKNRNAYIPYTDSEGNILKEEDIQFTDMVRGRRSMIWDDDEDNDETYTVLSDNVEAVYDDAGNFPISLKTTDKNSRDLPIKISAYTGETLAIHSGSCPVIDLIFTGPPGAGKTVAALMVNSSLFKDCIASTSNTSNASCSFTDDLPVGSPASKRYKRMERDLFDEEHQLPPPTAKGELIVPYQYYLTAKINERSRHRILRIHDIDGESCLDIGWKNRKMLACTNFVFLLPADELLSKAVGRTAYYEQVLNELLPKIRALKSDDYKLKVVISKADLLDPKDFYLAGALENSVRMSNGKLHKITHKKGFDEEAYNDRSQAVQAFLEAEAPNFYWSLVNQVDKSKLSFGLLSTLGCRPDEENNTYSELNPMFVDELIIPYLAEEGLYPYKKVSENEDEEYDEEETEKKGFWERFQESDKAKKFLKTMGLNLEDIDDEEEKDEETNKKEKYKWEEVS